VSNPDMVDSKPEQKPAAVAKPSQPHPDLSTTQQRSVDTSDDVNAGEAADLTAELDDLISERETEPKATAALAKRTGFAETARANVRQQHMLNHIRRMRSNGPNKNATACRCAS